MALVLVINVAQLITISVRYAIDNEEFANEWIDYNCSNLGKYITFDTIFIVWTGCIVTGITHVILFKIGEKRDSVCLMLSSVVLGIIKELVSNSLTPRQSKKAWVFFRLSFVLHYQFWLLYAFVWLKVEDVYTAWFGLFWRYYSTLLKLPYFITKSKYFNKVVLT